MKTGSVESADLARSVISVPPLARRADLTLDPDANRALIRHLERGGVSTLMYGGNANFYNVGLYEYAALLDFLAEAAAPGSWVIPSAGPDFGKLIDQARVLRDRAFPTAMVLPQTFPATPEGSARAIRLFADAFGRRVIVYVKAENFLTPALVARTRGRGHRRRHQVRDRPQGSARRSLPGRTRPARRPRTDRQRHRRAARRSSTCATSASRASRRARCALRRAVPHGSSPRLKARDYAAAEALRAAYMPLEDLRDELSPIRVLHEAVTLAGIADMGPMLPHLSNLPAGEHPRLEAAASALLAHDNALR